jgi:hypothetical protein
MEKYILLKDTEFGNNLFLKNTIKTIEEWIKIINQSKKHIDKNYFLNPTKINGEYQVGDFCKTHISLFRLYEPIIFNEFEEESNCFTYRINFDTHCKIPNKLLFEFQNYFKKNEIKMIEDKDFTYFYYFDNYEKLYDDAIEYIEEKLNEMNNKFQNENTI